MADEPLDDGEGELSPGEAESHFHERVGAAEVPEGDHTALAEDAQAEFMRRYNEQAG